MKALNFHGKRDVRVDEVPILDQDPTDAIVRITSTAICGADLHLYEVLGMFVERATSGSWFERQERGAIRGLPGHVLFWQLGRGYLNCMYLVPLIVLVVIALIATAWTPIFGVAVFVVGFVLFMTYVGLSRRSDQEVTPPQPGAEISASTVENEAEGGLWGERNPDKEGALHREGS